MAAYEATREEPEKKHTQQQQQQQQGNRLENSVWLQAIESESFPLFKSYRPIVLPRQTKAYSAHSAVSCSPVSVKPDE